MGVINLIKKRGVAGLFKKLKRRFIIANKHVNSEIAILGTYDYLQKYNYVKKYEHAGMPSDYTNPYPGRIWVCWLQGLDNAPLLVQKCVESIRQYSGKYEVVVLDKENIYKYVKLPEYINEKYDKGIIPAAHYADVVRVSLLKRYGGVWIDSTTLLLDELPAYIWENQLFCYKVAPDTKVYASNWFIASYAYHPVIVLLEAYLYEYWRREKRLVSYSIFHLFFSMAVDANEQNCETWKSVPAFPDENCKLLQSELFDPFNAERLEQIKQLSPVQKLSYKFSEECFEQKGTMYEKIVARNSARGIEENSGDGAK